MIPKIAMIKLIQNGSALIKSHKVQEIFDFIIANPELTFDILVGYNKVSHTDFCKIFLVENRNYKKYIKLESILHNTGSILDYGKVQNN